MLEHLVYYLSSITLDVPAMGNKVYDKSVSIGKWLAVLSLVLISFKFFMNRTDSAGEHFRSVIKGVFLLILAPTIIALLIWFANTLRL